MFGSYKLLYLLLLGILVAVFTVSCAAADKRECVHSFSGYVSDGNATYFSDGTKTAECKKGCGSKKTVDDNGSKLRLPSPGKLTSTQTTDSITVNWSKVENATGYRVYYKINNEWKILARSTKKTTCTVENLKPGFKVYFAVEAYKRGVLKTVWSDRKTELYTSTKCDSIKKLTSASTVTTVKLRWDKVSGADGYRVYVKASDGWKTVAKSTKKTSCTVKNLKSGKSYTFAVRPFVKTDSKVFSTYKTHKTSTLPEAPKAAIKLLSKNKISLSFKAVNGAQGYEIYRRINNGKSALYKTFEKPESISITLKPDKYYTYAVRAYRTVGGKKLYSKLRSICVHCGNTDDRIVVNPGQTNWNLVLINKERELPDGYKPMLTEIQNGYELDYRITPYFKKMYAAALKDGVELICNSAYRSVKYQGELFDIYTEEYMAIYGISREEAEAITATEVLAPGTSEHNLGFAVDILNSSGYEYTWLRENAHKFGFIERYTEDKQSITKIIPEPWHWRFVGVEYAEKIKNSGLCLEEYLEKYNLIP